MKGKGFISEGDVALLLRRYTTSAVLGLLQEISSSADSKLNWSVLAKSSNTGINNAKEYQSLWRHLAYRTKIPDNFEDDVPLDDDSDLEFEVEPVPGVSQEVATNVAACVKVLSATGTSTNVSQKNQEPCFIIDIPNSTSGWEVKGNGQISNTTAQNTQVSETQPVRKKRKLWTSEEDQELIAAVEKCGEGNWAIMLKGAFKHERTAAQLSQRWALIRKRRDLQTGTQNAGEQQIHAVGTNVAGCQLPVETPNTSQTDVQNVVTVGSAPSISRAPEHNLNQTAVVSNTTPVSQPVGKHKASAKRASVSGAQQGRSMAAPLHVSANAGQANPPLTSSVSLPGGTTVSARYVSTGTRNSPVNVGRTPSKSSAGPDPMIQAAAVAAGARIAPPSAAASLLKAAQSGNVVHIGIGGVPMGKAGTPNQTSSSAAGNSAKVGQTAGSKTSSGPVHYIRTGTGSSQSSTIIGQRPSPLKNQNRSGPQTVHTQAAQSSVRPGLAASSGPVILSQPTASTSTIISQHPPSAPTSITKMKANLVSCDNNNIAINDATPKTTGSPEAKIPFQDSSATGAPLHCTNDDSARCTSNNGSSGEDASKAEPLIPDVEATKINGAIET